MGSLDQLSWLSSKVLYVFPSCSLIQKWDLPAVCHEHFPLFFWQGEGGWVGVDISIQFVLWEESSVEEKKTHSMEAVGVCLIY